MPIYLSNNPMNSSPEIHYQNIAQQPTAFQTTAQKVIVVQNDQNVLKGALWGLATLKLGTGTLAVAISTLTTFPLIVTPLAPIPVVSGVLTYIFASMTNTCMENTAYHLGSSHKIVVLHNA